MHFDTSQDKAIAKECKNRADFVLDFCLIGPPCPTRSVCNQVQRIPGRGVGIAAPTFAKRIVYQKSVLPEVYGWRGLGGECPLASPK